MACKLHASLRSGTAAEVDVLLKAIGRPSGLAGLLRQVGIAAIAATLASFPSATEIGPGPDPHWIAVKPDSDNDLLTDLEELWLGTNVNEPDENQNLVRDGIDLALELASAVENLPRKPREDAPYRIDHPLFGLERCEVCGEMVNMGFVVLVNPVSKLYASMPYIALHFLEHGSFSSSGSIHQSLRLDPWLLRELMFRMGPSHIELGAAMYPDSDNDGLLDYEEQALMTDPTNPCSLTTGIPDGFAIARDLFQRIVSLPSDTSQEIYQAAHPLRGIVNCPYCGRAVNMGWVEIVNRLEGLQIELPYLALHCMQYGSLSYGQGKRVNPLLVHIALIGNGTSHLIPIEGDTDQDGLSDSEELALGTNPKLCSTLKPPLPDGATIARHLYTMLMALPESPEPVEGKRRVTIPADCYEPCPRCGEQVSCGLLEVIDDARQSRMRLTLMQVHFLQHGGFGPDGDSRVNPLELHALLSPSITIRLEQGDAVLQWFGLVGQTYLLYRAQSLMGPWDLIGRWSGTGKLIEFQERVASSAAFFRLQIE